MTEPDIINATFAARAAASGLLIVGGTQGSIGHLGRRTKGFCSVFRKCCEPFDNLRLH